MGTGERADGRFDLAAASLVRGRSPSAQVIAGSG